MNIIQSIMKVSSNILTNIVFVISMYYLCISFFGFYRKKEKESFKPKKSFALIVAAHNEELVIQDIIHSLKRVDYPKELYDIFVIADNCTDNTASKSRSEGAIVYERFHKTKRGKGYALEWMFDKIFKLDKKYDGIVVFDADNLASKNFLREMNSKLCEGYKVVQGYLDSKNPYDTWITGTYSVAFWTSNRMFQLSRKNLGLSNQLGGTGFCIETDILRELGWGATCLTEDLEFTCKLVLNGYKVGWAHDAVVYDEKPLTLAQSWWQRKRWMQGYADVSSRYFFKLIKKSIKEFNFAALDCALYSVQPIVIVLLGIATILDGLSRITNIPEFLNSLTKPIEVSTIGVILLIISALQFLYTPIVLFLDKKLNLRVLFFYLIFPVYTLTWIPIAVQGILDKNKKEWSHTQHTRSVNITDLEKVN